MPRIKNILHEDAGFRRVQQTGVYVGPSNGKDMGPDTRYYKAGDEAPPGYVFSHVRGGLPPAPPASPTPAKKDA
jgi:hypothetical protein